MKNKLFNNIIIILALLIFGSSIVLYLLDNIIWHELSHLVIVSYAFFIFGVLGLKERLNGQVLLESFKIVFLLYLIFCLFVFINQAEHLIKVSNFELKGFLLRTENFLMILLSITTIKSKWPDFLKSEKKKSTDKTSTLTRDSKI